MKVFFSFLAFNCLVIFSSLSQNKDAEYLNVLHQRAEKIVQTLEIEDKAVYDSVTHIIADQYRKLGVIHDQLDESKAAVKEKEMEESARESAIQNLNNFADSKLYHLHCEYLGALSVYLNCEQIEKVKDGMTYGVVKVTYDSYLDMIPTLKDEEKKQIYAWLVEAREHAMDASSSKAKHGWFGKYKGRINNYLSKQGYNTQEERKAWEERVKARGGSL